MLHLMPFCLLLKNKIYRIGDAFFSIWELLQDLRSDFAYAPQASLLYVKIGEIIASKFIIARNGGSLLSRGGRDGPFLSLSSANEKLPVEEMSVPK